MEHLVGFCRAMKTRLNQMTTLGYLGNGKTRLETELARTGVLEGIRLGHTVYYWLGTLKYWGHVDGMSGTDEQYPICLNMEWNTSIFTNFFLTSLLDYNFCRICHIVKSSNSIMS